MSKIRKAKIINPVAKNLRINRSWVEKNRGKEKQVPAIDEEICPFCGSELGVIFINGIEQCASCKKEVKTSFLSSIE